MLYLPSVALAFTLAFSPTLASLSPPPDQLAFTSPSIPSTPHEHLLRLAWTDRSDLQTAVHLFEQHNLDVWFAGKRSSPPPDSDPSLPAAPSTRWETVLRWPTDQDPLDSVLDRLAEAGIPPPDAGRQVSSLSDRLSSPLVTPAYSRSLSAATLLNSSSSSSAALLSPAEDPIHATYHPFDGIYQILKTWEAAWPEWLSVYSIGKSSEGRDIWAVKVSKLSNVPEEARSASSDEEDDEDEDDDLPEFEPPPLRINTKKRHKHRRSRPLSFVIAGTQHAREWIAPSTILYLIHDLVSVEEGEGQRRSEKQRAKLLNQVEFTFVPVVNPDGYVYSWDQDRLWRKSRQPVGKDGECFGIDLNRNWGYHFAPGSRPNPCSDSYPGAEAFESVELQALSSLLADKDKPVDAFLDVHSFGQMLLYPYSYTCTLTTPDEENQSEALLRMSAALKRVHGRQFETGSVCEVSLTSPGESLDWSYSTARIRWSFATELRDGGVFGFLLPPSQIRPSGEEMSAALRSLTQFVLDKEAGKR